MLEAQELALPSSPSVTLAGLRSIVSIAAFKNRLTDLQAAIGQALPLTPMFAVHGDTHYLWSGPQSWLAISPDPGLFTRLAPLQHLAAVTEQSDGRVIFRIAHPDARDYLARLVPIDLDAAAFPPRATALTLAGHVSVQIWRADDGAFEISCFRSFAAALHHDLTAAIDLGARHVG